MHGPGGALGYLAPGRDPVTAGPAGPDGPDAPVVTVSGEPVELLLVAYGRLRVASVELEGAPEAIDALRAAHLGVS